MRSSRGISSPNKNNGPMKGLLASIHNGDKDHKCTIDPTKFSNPIEDIEHKQVEKNQMENTLMNSKFPRSINVGYVNVRQGAAKMYLAKCSHFIVGVISLWGPLWVHLEVGPEEG